MSKYEVNTILSMWAQDKLTVEQAVGQILQHLQALLGRVGQVEKQVEQMRRQEERGTAVSATAKTNLAQETAAAPQTQAEERTEPVVESAALEAEANDPPDLPISEASDVPLVPPDEEKADMGELENGQGVEDADYR
ncbi:MAG: hypothetical protein KDE56_06290 [Anaerolineales bacterium]|nr:hypothetical protein [Anaerolineales bacterium]